MQKAKTASLISSDGGSTIQRATRTFAQAFGEEVRSQRQKIGLKQEDLSSLLQTHGIHVSQSYLSRLEGGIRGDPNVQIIISLSIMLDISLDGLIREIAKE